MSNLSANLSLPFIQPSQAQKHVTHNEALLRLDTVVQLSVQLIGAETPPAAPANGEIFALGASATGDWAGQDGKLACYSDNAWAFITPQDGWRAFNFDDNGLHVFSAGTWLPVVPPLQNLAGLGVGTSSDAANRLAVASDAALFTHDGSDHRLTINKASMSDTASLVMQSGWSGRAELGLTGDEDFHFRTSADGSTWVTAFSLRTSNGQLDAKCFRSGTIDIQNDSVGYIPTPSAGGMVAINLVDDGYPQVALSGLFSYDTGQSLSLLALAVGSHMENLGATALTGTSSTDGKAALAVASDTLQIENRRNGPRRFAYTFLNAY